MAAFAFESANKTWQRARLLVSNAGAGSAAPYNTANPNPGIQLAFKELKTYLAQHKGFPDMQLLTFTDAQIIAAGGILLATGTAKLVMLYVAKTGTAGVGTATLSVVKVHDDATDDTTAANGRVAIPLKAANDARIYVDFQGLALANGLVVNADTSMEGTTDSTAGDAGPGFALVANF